MYPYQTLCGQSATFSTHLFHEQHRTQPGVYFFLRTDPRGLLPPTWIYIGKAVDMHDRIQEHLRDPSLWAFSPNQLWITYGGTADQRSRIEEDMIRRLRPLKNIQHNAYGMGPLLRRIPPLLGTPATKTSNYGMGANVRGYSVMATRSKGGSL